HAPGVRGEAEPDRRHRPRRLGARARGGEGSDARGAIESEAGAVSDENGASDSLTLRVGEFEGPLDLLLHLCRTNEIDLTQLPVRPITDQYLAHLEAFEFQDLETAGAYLVMAATLIYLKSKLLVPPDENALDEALDDEALALKQELEERLREYARVKA